MKGEDLTNRNYYYVPISINDRLPELYKWVPAVDLDDQITMYQLTEYGWNMRDTPATNTPRDLPIVSWLEKRVLLS